MNSKQYKDSISQSVTRIQDSNKCQYICMIAYIDLQINPYNDLPINKKKLPLLGIKPRNQHIESKQKNNETKTKQKEAKRIITNYKEN